MLMETEFNWLYFYSFLVFCANRMVTWQKRTLSTRL
ncbi:hypothetical protein CYPRO_0585 [Cyclonatronum proteinivorum]|uniref:Uncharacterized protein n=1 Tax=Cyclonatronum proteinivorum TaxID=1457365 RepID=A0A345UHB8_9BACT|nr:hypothetical protein CYPRO_0585 [Cyclonatronum proteinivorum]